MPAEPRPLRRGRRLAPGLTVVALLARGEALDVYDAWDDRRHSRCVVKTPRPDRAAEARVQQRLRREGRLLARLAHPHLVRAYEVLESPRLAVVLEPLAGEPLDDLLDDLRRPLPAAQLAVLGGQLGGALRYLHASGHLHLDVKPGNVIVDNGVAKLLDLSLARRPGRSRRGVGTPDYMAPEQVRGGDLTPAADVWGLGTVLFEAATLRPAFTPPADGGYAQVVDRAPRLGTLRRLPAPLSRLIDACLHPDPGERPSLEAVLAGLGGSAGR